MYKNIQADVCDFCELGSGLRLRSYQKQVARKIVRRILVGLGMSIVVIFPRQSGKNELQSQLKTYLLVLLELTEAEMVKVSPTWKPQSLNAMRRFALHVLRRRRGSTPALGVGGDAWGGSDGCGK